MVWSNLKTKTVAFTGTYKCNDPLSWTNPSRMTGKTLLLSSPEFENALKWPEPGTTDPLF